MVKGVKEDNLVQGYHNLIHLLCLQSNCSEETVLKEETRELRKRNLKRNEEPVKISSRMSINF